MQNAMMDGTHEGTTKGATMYEAESGALVTCFDVEVDGSGGVVMRGWITLAQKDNTLNERGFADVRSILGWKDWDWQAWHQPAEHFAGHRVSVVLETKPDEQSGLPKQRIRYVNPQSAGLKRGDARTIAAKYGPRLRALTGGSPAAATARPAAASPTPAAPKPVVPLPATPPAAQGAPQATVPVTPSSMDDCWALFCQRSGGKSPKEIETTWFSLVSRLYPGRDTTDLTPTDWGAVMVAINDDLPF